MGDRPQGVWSCRQGRPQATGSPTRHRTTTSCHERIQVPHIPRGTRHVLHPPVPAQHFGRGTHPSRHHHAWIPDASICPSTPTTNTPAHTVVRLCVESDTHCRQQTHGSKKNPAMGLPVSADLTRKYRTEESHTSTPSLASCSRITARGAGDSRLDCCTATTSHVPRW